MQAPKEQPRLARVPGRGDPEAEAFPEKPARNLGPAGLLDEMPHGGGTASVPPPARLLGGARAGDHDTFV